MTDFWLCVIGVALISVISTFYLFRYISDTEEATKDDLKRQIRNLKGQLKDSQDEARKFEYDMMYLNDNFISEKNRNESIRAELDDYRSRYKILEREQLTHESVLSERDQLARCLLEVDKKRMNAEAYGIRLKRKFLGFIEDLSASIEEKDGKGLVRKVRELRDREVSKLENMNAPEPTKSPCMELAKRLKNSYR
jgi:uncharacterized protein (DUF3084 family)